MLSISSFHSSFLAFFYQDHTKFMFLVSSIFQKNVNLFKNSIGLSDKLPDFQELKEFLTPPDEMKETLSFDDFFERSKVFFMWLFSVYEIMTCKSFDSFSNEDWVNLVGPFLPNADIFTYKCKLFSYFKPSVIPKKWEFHQDESLRLFIKNNYMLIPILDSDWSQISQEFNKNFEQMRFFRTEKQCKERWFNHLTNKKYWTLEEDIKLLSEYLKKPNKWAKISRKFIDKNQNQIKKRFFIIMVEEINCKTTKIKELIRENSLIGPIFFVLEKLEQKLNEKKEML